MPYANEHSARVKNPDNFDKDSFRRKNITDGVDIIIGKLSGSDTTETQAYRFDAQKFTADEAKKWLTDNNVEYIEFEPAANDKVIEGHVFVYGEIIPWQDEKAKEYGGINLKDIVNQINSAKEANRLVVHIHSPGGDVWEGFAIHDALVNSGKEITTIIEGLCASIATVIALAGDRRLMTEHSEFLIHNPWAFSIGDSSDFKKVSDDLAKTENKLAEFYAKKTNLSTDQLLSYMHEETIFSAKEAQDFGFVTEIIATIKQVAHFKNNINNTNMKNESETVKKLSAIEMMLNGIKNLLVPKKNIVIQDTDGKEMDFGDNIKTQEEIKVGDTATVDGAPATGDHTLADGTVYKFDAGKLTEIVEPAGDDQEMEKLRAENEELKRQLQEKTDSLKTEAKKVSDLTVMVNKLDADFKNFKSMFSDDDPPGTVVPSGGAPAARHAYKTK